MSEQYSMGGELLHRRASDRNLDISPLPLAQRRGLIAVSIMAFISFIASAILLTLITYRLIFWKSSYRKYIGYNQYIILIYNLVLADFLQSIAYLICLKWIITNQIKSGTAACFLQGLGLQIANPGSGLFVLGIAFHTFLLVVLDHKMSHNVFVSFVCGLWAGIAVLGIIPLAAHGVDVFVPSGAWCWINEEYEPLRLWAHYIWIFAAEFGTVCLYTVMYFQLRRQISISSILSNIQLENLRRLQRIVFYMTIYPTVYIVLSLPLAAGRMANLNGKNPSIAFFCCAGAIITSSGFVDVILYSLTRRNLIFDSEPSLHRSYDRFANHCEYRGGHLTAITAGSTSRKNGATDNVLADCESSTDGIICSGVEMGPIGEVYLETTIEVTIEPASSRENGERSNSDAS